MYCKVQAVHTSQLEGGQLQDIILYSTLEPLQYLGIPTVHEIYYMYLSLLVLDSTCTLLDSKSRPIRAITNKS